MVFTITPEQNCKRKKGYPILSMAERDMQNMQKEFGEELNTYKCDICGKFHIGHLAKKTLQFTYEELKSGVLPISETEILVNLRNGSEFYVYKIPNRLANDTPDIIMEEGELVAYKEYKQPYYEMNGVRSLNWQVFTEMAHRQILQFHGHREILDFSLNNMVPLDCILLHPSKSISPVPVLANATVSVLTPEVASSVNTIKTLKCSKCGEEKPLTAYYHKKNGYLQHSYCKECHKVTAVEARRMRKAAKKQESIDKAITLLQRLFQLSCDEDISGEYFKGYVKGLAENAVLGI